eukprot:TRINITY_DN18403_c0_g1_i1.p1 TRINITY_DN18403_c0_g1~~TRINITY_DN18403_c0_g1_i1.p1  ORF type:complete len:562 (+),score=108.44 TRINITY_DN18403_c0_g1_i1:83-1768(+)
MDPEEEEEDTSSRLFSLLKDSNVALVFDRFLGQADRTDDLVFVLEVEDYRTLATEENVKARADAIYQRFFSSQAKIQFEEKQAEDIKAVISSPDKNTFDSVQKAVIANLEEMLPRFYESEPYRKCKKEAKARSKKKMTPKISSSPSGFLEKFTKQFSNSPTSSQSARTAPSPDFSSVNESPGPSVERESKKEEKTKRIASKKTQPNLRRTSSNLSETTLRLISSFEEIILEPSYTIVKIICEAEAKKSCRDELFTSVVNVFVHNDLIVSLLKLQFRREIQLKSNTTDPTTLFRGETAAVKLMSKYFILEGKTYLHSFVRPLVSKITQSGSLEVNSQKLDPGENAQDNAIKLLAVTQEFIDQFCQNPNQCPVKFRHVFITVLREVKNIYPQLAETIVGTLLFLRFICPAITCPHQYGIDDVIFNEASQRSLILVSKLLQNLVNGVEFDGSKEKYMVALNGFITNNTNTVKKFIETIVDEDILRKDEANNQHSYKPRTFKTISSSLTCIRNFLMEHKDVVWDNLTHSPELLSRFKNLVFFGLVQIDFQYEKSPSLLATTRDFH